MARYEKAIGPEWHISEQGYTDLSQNGLIKDERIIFRNAIDSDLKDIGTQVLNTEISKNKIQELVLQIHKIRNVAAPKSNEDSKVAPRMLKLTLTDGHSFCQGIEMENIPEINLERTPPGSKVLLKNAVLKSGYVLLHPSSCIFLGGKVPALYEKWEISRSILNSAKRRSSNADGPPAWVNFGTKVASADDASFRSLNDKSKSEQKQESEFDAQRKGAIAEASSGAVRKVFGGGSKRLTDTQVTEVNKQYTSRERVNRDKRRNEPKERIVDNTQTKPPEKVSLFHFLEDKLSANDPQPVTSVAAKESNQRNDRTPHGNYSNGDLNRNAHQNTYKENARDNTRINNRYNQRQYNSRKPENGSSDKSNQQVLEPVPVNSNSVDAITNNMGKMSVNSQFASRSLKQHLNLSKTTSDAANTSKSASWKIGDSCLAKYWEDGKFYNATITDITENTLVVLFNDYGNVEEVLKSDCKQHSSNKPFQHQRYFTRKYPAGKSDTRKYPGKPS